MTPGRRRFLGAAGGLLGAAAGLRPRGAWAQRNSTLRFVPYTDLALLDPIYSTNFATRNHALLVFETLYGLDAQFRPQPQMLAGATVEPDGLTWTLVLRDGLTFHDGARVLARDAVASLRRWGARDSFGSALFAATAELSAPDDRTIRFRLTRPFPLLPDALAKVSSYVPVIMPERLATQPGNVQVTEMVGSGPYRFVAEERVPGARVVYRRNGRYVPRDGGAASFLAGPKVAHFDRIEWQTIPDNATAIAALIAGEVDWIEQPNIDLLPLLRRDANVRVDVVETAGLIGQLRLNHLQPPFDKPAVCRAVLGAVDQTAMMDAVTGNDPEIRREPVGIFTPGSPSASDAGMEALLGKRDLAASRRALEAAGYAGETVRLLAGTDVPRTNAVCEVARETLRAIGMTVDYVATDFGTVVQRILSDKPVSAGGWSCYGVYSGGLDTYSPASHLAIRGIGHAGVPGWLSDPALETLRDSWFAAADEAARREAARAIQAEALKAGAYVPCLFYTPPTAYRRDLVDVARGLPVFTGVRRG
jgi:peptide/nickel transport system substrate-binding protein